jgi:PAS domain-containing protein
MPDAYALLDALFAHAPMGLAFWDEDLRYRRINGALAAMNGLAPEDHLGRTTNEVLGDELGDQLVAVAEVDVERLARERGALHHRHHGHLVRRPLAKQRLGRIEDLALGVLRPPAPPRAFAGPCAGHAAEPTGAGGPG